MLKLQEIIIPRKTVEKTMFYRGETALKCGNTLSFDTYFNSFSYTKYRDYTKADDVTFSCKFKGRVSIALCYFDGEEHIIFQKEAESFAELHTDLSWLPERGFLYPKIIAITDCVFIEGGYYSECEPSKIKASIAICTYKREQFALKNIKLLRSRKFSFIERVFVVDNGKTLDSSALSDDYIKILPNKNLGGSGGFTRGIIEAYNESCSHVILMDDDVEFFPETLEHITIFISILKTEYIDSCLSAAMLLLSEKEPYIQWEMGGNWTGRCIESRKHNADIREKSVLMDNIDNNYVKYGAWWCFCMPLSLLKNGLPMPFFIKLDDVEYGLRNSVDTTVITMNGAAVFHESFENKMNFTMDYYTIRNELAVSALYGGNARTAALIFLSTIGKELIFYRYENIPLICKAVNDFLGGVDFFLACDEERLNSKLRQKTVKLVPLTEIDGWNKAETEFLPNIKSKKGRFKALASNFLPCFFLKKRMAAVAIPYASPENFIARKAVIQYQLDKQTGVLTKRSFGKFLKFGFVAAATALKLLVNFSKIKKDFLARKGEITSFEFWRKRLTISEY